MVAAGPEYLAPSKLDASLAREVGKPQAESRDLLTTSLDALYYHPHHFRDKDTSGTLPYWDEEREEYRRLRKQRAIMVDELAQCEQDEDLFLARYSAASAACAQLEVIVARIGASEDAAKRDRDSRMIPVRKVHIAFESSESASQGLVDESGALVITGQYKRVTRSSANASAALKRH